MRAAYVQQRGETVCAGHGQVEQHQVHIRVRVEGFGQGLGAGHLAYLCQRQALPQ